MTEETRIKKSANRIKFLRENADESQNDCAEAIGVSQVAWSYYENGTRSPSDEIKTRIAKHFHKTVQEIFFAE